MEAHAEKRKGGEEFYEGWMFGISAEVAVLPVFEAAKRWVDSSKVWDCWRTEVTSRIAMMARRIAAMRLVMRGVRAGGWRAVGSGILFDFREVGYAPGGGWSSWAHESCCCSEHDTDS
jgi:hypothetical protein